jgi:hypothetical protein
MMRYLFGIADQPITIGDPVTVRTRRRRWPLFWRRVAIVVPCKTGTTPVGIAAESADQGEKVFILIQGWF